MIKIVLTDFFLKRELRKLLRQASVRPHRYRSFDEIRNILIVCHTKDWDFVRVCIEKLRTMNKTVDTAIYSPTRNDVPTWYSNYLLFCADKEVNMWGFPNKTIRQQFCNLRADLVIDLLGAEYSAMYYMFLQHPSTFKVGFKQSEQSAYDLSIIPPNSNSNLQYLFDQLISYLKILTSPST